MGKKQTTMKLLFGLFTLLCVVSLEPVKSGNFYQLIKSSTKFNNWSWYNCFFFHTDCDTDVCLLPPVTGNCKAAIPRYYFNKCTGACEEFTYGGCGGNGNNFSNLIDCQNQCRKRKWNDDFIDKIVANNWV